MTSPFDFNAPPVSQLVMSRKQRDEMKTSTNPCCRRHCRNHTQHIQLLLKYHTGTVAWLINIKVSENSQSDTGHSLQCLFPNKAWWGTTQSPPPHIHVHPKHSMQVCTCTVLWNLIENKLRRVTINNKSTAHGVKSTSWKYALHAVAF